MMVNRKLTEVMRNAAGGLSQEDIQALNAFLEIEKISATPKEVLVEQLAKINGVNTKTMFARQSQPALVQQYAIAKYGNGILDLAGNGKAVYDMLSRFERTIIPAGVESGFVRQNINGSFLMIRKVGNQNFVIAENTGYSLANALKRYLALGGKDKGLRLARTTMGYSILAPV